MRILLLTCSLGILMLVFAVADLSGQVPQGTAFTYQGELRQNGVAVTASVDMVFELLDAPTGGNPAGPVLSFTAGNGNPVPVQNGIFTVALDFGALAFNTLVSDERFLKVTINGNALAPRTKIENAPYALQARTSELAYTVSNASVGAAQIVASQVQQRVSGTCAVGSSIQSIAQNGTVTCQSGSGGTVTSVGAGSGLSGGPITGSGTLAVANGGIGLAQIDSSVVQARVTGSCTSNEKVLSVNSNGTVVCGNDAIGGAGSVTNIASGTGLTGGPISSSGTLSIADGGVGVAQINTSQVQARVGGVCALGEYVRGINSDGSVVCAPVLAAQRTATVDSLGSVGSQTSIAIGADGLPVVSYLDSTNQDLKVAHCSNAACSIATATTVDSTGSRGFYSSIAIGADGLPIVSYLDNTNGDLEVAHCTNVYCTGGALITAVDVVGIVGTYSSISIGSDGLPVISYYDSTNADLKVAHCGNSSCTTSNLLTAVDTGGIVGTYTSLAIGSDGLPVVSYYDQTNGDLKVAHCTTAACSSSTRTTVDSVGNVGWYTAIKIGTDGMPVIGYYDITNGDLKVAHCSNAACTGATTGAVDSVGDQGYYIALAIGADGLPILSYSSGVDGDLRIARCADLSCTTAAVVAVGTHVSTSYSAISIGADSLPVVSYSDVSNDDLKVLKCNNRFCQ